MPQMHTVSAGEGLAQIAFRYGLTAAKIWDHPGNTALRETREFPEILAPGDTLQIPDIAPRVEGCSTDEVHSFRLHGVPVPFQLRLLDDGEPRAGEAYKLKVGRHAFDGNLDGDGWLRVLVMPDATIGTLSLRNGSEEYTILLAHMDPVGIESGLRDRLRNLGYIEDGKPTEDELKAAITTFQISQGFDETGVADDHTRAALVDVHGS